MSCKFKKGDQVTQILPTPIVGKVSGFDLCQETGEVTVKVEYADPDGSIHVRNFKQTEIEAELEVELLK